MEEELLWVARKWIDSNGLEHTETYDCKTGEYTEEWHPIEPDSQE